MFTMVASIGWFSTREGRTANGRRASSARRPFAITLPIGVQGTATGTTTDFA
jgi:hypothetical protein